MDKAINRESEGIEVTLPNGAYYEGTWHVIEGAIKHGQELFLLEHDELGDAHPCVIVDRNNNVILEDVWNGFDEYAERIEDKVERFDLPIPIEYNSTRGGITLSRQYKLPYDLAFVDDAGNKYEIYQGIINKGDMHVFLKNAESGDCLYSARFNEAYASGEIELANANISGFSFETIACGCNIIDIRYRRVVFDIVQEIGRYESSAKIPYKESVVEWFGDYALYELKRHVTEDLLSEIYLKALDYREKFGTQFIEEWEREHEEKLPEEQRTIVYEYTQNKDLSYKSIEEKIREFLMSFKHERGSNETKRKQIRR